MTMSEQNCLNPSLSNCLALFEMITFGIQNRQTMFFDMKFLVFFSVILARGSAFIYNGERFSYDIGLDQFNHFFFYNFESIRGELPSFFGELEDIQDL